MAEDECRVELLAGADRGLLAAVTAIYEEAFPPSERKPSSFLDDAVAREDYEMLVARTGDDVAAFALTYSSSAQSLCLLEYLATARALRNRSFGSMLFETVLDRHRGASILIEAEAKAPATDQASVLRRQAFYRRLGCRQLGEVPYKMPRVGSQAPPPMHLLVGGEVPPLIPRDRLQAWLRDIYENVYGLEDPDPLVHQVLRDQPSSIPLL
jgi:GNAT superfamily N-acetyltransferase